MKCSKPARMWSVDSLENTWTCCHHMSHFKAEMHQIRFRLELRPRPYWGSSQLSPRLPSWIEGVLLLKEGEGRGRKGEGKGEEGEWEGREGEGKGEGGEGRDWTSPAWSSPDLGSTAFHGAVGRRLAVGRFRWQVRQSGMHYRTVWEIQSWL